jgi:hypothetical protein
MYIHSKKKLQDQYQGKNNFYFLLFISPTSIDNVNIKSKKKKIDNVNIIGVKDQRNVKDNTNIFRQNTFTKFKLKISLVCINLKYFKI